MLRNSGLIFMFAFLLATVPAVYGQGVTGQITGNLTDQSGAAIPKAEVDLTYVITGQMRKANTEQNGSFLFPDLIPGEYALHIAQPGFKAYDQKGIVVSQMSSFDLNEIKLTVGDVGTSVEVQAEESHVETETSDREITMTRPIIDDTPIRGRDYLGTLSALPGVAAVTTNDQPGYKASGPTINGGNGQFVINIDGIVEQDAGGLGATGEFAPNLDAIGEVQVLTSNYDAQYGMRAGGQFNVSIKNGTNQFHGTAYYYLRHEEFNANEWFNNAQKVAKPLYRYQNPGGTIGGPVIIPGTRFNKDRTKLFFFYSYDYLHTKIPTSLNEYNMPTALERQGNFSQSVTSTGALIPILNPTTGVQFPGNIMPSSLINPTGAAVMNLFPLPFTEDPTGQRQYNSIYQWTKIAPSSDKILRMDYNLGKKTTSYLRLLQHAQTTEGVGAFVLGSLGNTFTNANGGWGQYPTSFEVPSAAISTTVVHTFAPNLVNETTFGINRSYEHAIVPTTAAYAAENELPLKGANGQPISLPSFFSGNALNDLPNFVFTTTSPQSAGQTVTNPPGFTFPSRWPFQGTDQLTSLTNNITWVKGNHSFKAGYYLEHVSRNVTVYGTYDTDGTYWFGSDTANPNDTGYAYSNLLYGTIQAYGQDNKTFVNHARYNENEWFIQDTWRVSRKLTIDYGMRFEIIQPAYSLGNTLGFFNASDYNESQSGQVLFPALVGGKKESINPKTGAVYPYVYESFFDPASFNGNDPYSGIAQYKSKFFNTPPPHLAPRIGFAWNVFGNGKLAVRGGFGIFYDNPYGVDTIGATTAGTGPVAAPPSFQSPIFYDTTFSNLASAPALYGAANVDGGSQNIKNPTTYEWSLGVQQNLGHGFILDTAYVGNVEHHAEGQSYDPSDIPPLTTWNPTTGANPAYLDPTSSSGGKGGFYTASLIKALLGYEGYASIPSFTWKGEAYYDALQVQINRRFGKDFQLAFNYTWSRDLTFSPAQWVSDEITKNVSGRTNVVNVTFGYAIPDGSKLIQNSFLQSPIMKGVLDGWHVNGVLAFFSGLPLGVSCTPVSAPIGWPTGIPSNTGIPQRCEMTGPLFLPNGTPPPSNTTARVWWPIDSASFSLPPGTTLGLGNAPPTVTYGPGFENNDLSVFKAFRIREKATLELRAEAFNTFNHFNPANPNTTLQLNYTTGVNTNANFGVISASENQARHMVVSLKLRF